MDTSRVRLSCLVLGWVGCASSSKSKGATPRYEHVYWFPLEQAMAEATKLLRERGFTFEPLESEKGETRLLSSWDTPSKGTGGNAKLTRYLLVGLQVAPKQSVVRIFRLTRSVIGNDAELRFLSDRLAYEEEEQNENIIQTRGRNFHKKNIAETRGALYGLRAEDLERELTLRLESRASIELVAGNLKTEDPKLPARRNEDFYLQRWKQQAEGSSPTPASELCGTEVRGLRELLNPGQTLLIGEQLGSQQLPATVGDMVCQAAEAGHIVTLGLSIPRTEQERLDRYLTSAGGPADQDELLDGDFWRRPYQDGRSSRAVMDLIDRVRALRAAGLLIHLVAYDTDQVQGNERDAALADVWLKRRAARPEELFFVVSGNAHVSISKGTQWDSRFVSMGWHLLKADPTVKALDMSFTPGTRWACDLDVANKLDCRVYGSTPSNVIAGVGGQSPYIDLFLGGLSFEGYHGLLYVGELSASPPALAPDAIPVRPISPLAPRKRPIQTHGL
ncbi:hypothetical protein JQX13_48350 [Archangium violaceum]|uniref:hypothetical protein n=1 Tax=Archangium violaceum TaxID=83451 RepID=UPI00193C0C5A|nr:hypothetical protein [Archangium violaceum]QRK07718.1 hypothetical protein JQX13_48350 [Archangium violaceum]